MTGAEDAQDRGTTGIRGIIIGFVVLYGAVALFGAIGWWLS